MADLEHARVAKTHLQHVLKESVHVRGVGIAPTGDGYCLQVNVRADADAHDVPSEVDGVKVLVKVVGELRPRL
ncbi:hypothetical protein [Cellulomonas bogoriensis]|uniref:Uncharacterized protein n=1 Tax=Cellulomonas bogoriensis 69B4 = DSM 16987 TaxID=1386082 RepID=A0A0A0BWE5_9CELL|nr:hypothetical protein [Cellulomonas bogoriensis]KGM12027.1 hypothetical protein N869_02160 [Cellulomonas bogoriensis 69B4 = DSM 16987]